MRLIHDRNREVYEMKRNIKKLTAVLLCLTLVLSLAACGGGGGTSNTKDPYEIKAEFDP